MPFDRNTAAPSRPGPSPVPTAAGDFKFEEFFAGAVRGHGIVTDRFGRLRRTFVVDMVGHWEDGSFVLDEYFRYGDGMADSKLKIPAAKTGTARNMNTIAKLVDWATE